VEPRYFSARYAHALPFATGSADAVYASHFLEHPYREEGPQLM
jgi:predicted SAM-dependent methyltransferase